MKMNNKNLLQISDWVKGKLKDGELVHGYIESVDSLSGTVKINIVSSDNEKTIGKTIETLDKWVEKLPLAPDRENQLLSLIDLALLTGDQQWFKELTDTLKALKDAPKSKGKADSPANRIENIEQKSGIKE